MLKKTLIALIFSSYSFIVSADLPRVVCVFRTSNMQALQEKIETTVKEEGSTMSSIELSAPSLVTDHKNNSITACVTVSYRR